MSDEERLEYLQELIIPFLTSRVSLLAEGVFLFINEDVGSYKGNYDEVHGFILGIIAARTSTSL